MAFPYAVSEDCDAMSYPPPAADSPYYLTINVFPGVPKGDVPGTWRFEVDLLSAPFGNGPEVACAETRTSGLKTRTTDDMHGPSGMMPNTWATVLPPSLSYEEPKPLAGGSAILIRGEVPRITEDEALRSYTTHTVIGATLDLRIAVP